MSDFVKDTNVPANDCISRQDAIEAIMKKPAWHCSEGSYYHSSDIKDALEDLPSAKPERLTDDDFETVRIHLNAYKESLCNQRRFEEAEAFQRIIDRFMAFASAQSEIIRCKDCKHLDTEGPKCDCGHGLVWRLSRRDDWLCADAERRTDE